MRRSTLVGVAACLLASAQDEPLIPVRVVFSNPHAVSLHLYWFDPETPEVGSFLMTLAPSEERPVDTFIGEEYGVALDGAEELGARFSVRGALEPTHSAAIDDEVLCEFGAWPAGVPPPAAVLADVLPRLSAGNALAPESFNATRSAKWQFGGGALPGALEAAMEHDESALAWARPLVAALAEDGADAFLLNALAVPCGAEVAAHYDDSLSRGRTGVRVAIAFVDVPRGRWAGGEFQAYASQAGALAGQPPLCTVAPVVGAVATFRGDLYHGVTALECDAATAGERVSIVLEQYDTARHPDIATATTAGWRSAAEVVSFPLPLPDATEPTPQPAARPRRAVDFEL